MKTAISIPDDVFKRAERLAKSNRISRSELFTRAIKLLLQSEPSAELRRAYDDAFSDHDHDHDRDNDRFEDNAARTALLSVEWNEK